MTVRIAVSTGGGDCPGLNAVIRAVVKSASSRGWEVWGIRDGFEGLFKQDETGVFPLTAENVRGILPRGGTVLGTSNRGNPFLGRTREQDGAYTTFDRTDELLGKLRSYKLDALVMIGGDGTLRIAKQLGDYGIGVVGVPKTIDNDLEATEVTFGFDTALATATDAIDRLHTTAESHHRVMVLEVMGRHAGWIALESGIAGGGDIILIPEIPFRLESVIDHVGERSEHNREFSIIVASEGAVLQNGEPFYRQPLGADPHSPRRLGGVGQWLEEQLTGRIQHEVRTTALGHLQRGGSPTARDRILASRFGARAVDLIADGLLGHMVAVHANKVVPVPIADAVAKPKLVDPCGEQVDVARALGISFGD